MVLITMFLCLLAMGALAVFISLAGIFFFEEAPKTSAALMKVGLWSFYGYVAGILVVAITAIMNPIIC